MWGAIYRKLFHLLRSKILYFPFFQKKFQCFYVARWEIDKEIKKYPFKKLFSKVGCTR